MEDLLVTQVPTNLPPLFNGERYIIYAYLPSSTAKGIAKLSAKLSTGTIEFKLKVDTSKAIRGVTFHTLAAKSLIK